MADQLVTEEEFETFAGVTGLDSPRAELLLAAATAEVQAAAGQRLVLVEDDSIEFFSYAGPYLTLPERPVARISSLALDGAALTEGIDYKRPARSAQLWRSCGWAATPTAPSIVAVTYDHGYAVEAQELEFARSAVFGIGRMALDAPTGTVVAESIDDYRVQYAAGVVWAMEQSPHLAKALARAYGARAGIVRLG